MQFWDALVTFLFTPGQGKLDGMSNGYLIFATASAFWGLVVVGIDFLLYKLKGKSFLTMTYRGFGTLLIFVLWGIGAGLGGLIGAASVVVQLNLQACAIVGVSWPLILPRLLKAGEALEERQNETVEEE